VIAPVAAVDRDRLSDERDGGVILADLMRENAQEMQRFGVLRLDIEDLPIDPLGLGKPAGLMMRESRGKGVLNRRHGTLVAQRMSGGKRSDRQYPACEFGKDFNTVSLAVSPARAGLGWSASLRGCTGPLPSRGIR
jgi:hypothetical protein